MTDKHKVKSIEEFNDSTEIANALMRISEDETAENSYWLQEAAIHIISLHEMANDAQKKITRLQKEIELIKGRPYILNRYNSDDKIDLNAPFTNDISTRARNSLKAAGILTPREVLAIVETDERELLKIPKFGRKQFLEIKDYLLMFYTHTWRIK